MLRLAARTEVPELDKNTRGSQKVLGNPLLTENER